MGHRQEVLDLRGLKCPHVALATKRALKGKVKGDELTILCTDPMAALDIPLLAEQLGHHATAGDQFDDHFTIIVTVQESIHNPQDVWPSTS